MHLKTRLFALFLPLLLLGCGDPPDTHPGQPVTHRRAAFTQMLKPFEAMGVQLRKDQYNADQFLALSKQFAAAREVPWTYFGPDTNYPPTRATAKVWSEPEKFEAGREAFLKAGSALIAAAESRDEKMIRSAYAALHDTCRSCHKIYKD